MASQTRKTPTLRVALVNLPHETPVMRRYVASYYAPNFLIPPLELMGLGAVAKERHGGAALLVDAVAEKLSLEETRRRVAAFAPDVLVSMTGFEIFHKDVAAFDRIAGAVPEAEPVLFGYLPTVFPRETLKNTAARIVIRGEPELAFSAWLERLEKGRSPRGLPGLAYKSGGRVFVGPEPERIADLDALPFPDHGLADLSLYNESFVRGPIAAILSARGCPHRCTFCVRTYGRRLRERSAENILKEIKRLRENHGVKSLRFLDDTFTLNRPRLLAVAEGIRRIDPRLTWTCLTRLDALHDEDLPFLKKSGCLRMYVGVESGSQRILDFYRKGIALDLIRRKTAALKRAGIEVSAFFIVGAPGETRADVGRSIDFARELDFEYIIVTRLQLWPGTYLFEELGAAVGFTLFPETSFTLAGSQTREDYFELEKLFYRRFYLRPRYVARRLATLSRSPRDILAGFTRLARYLLPKGPRRDFI